MTVSTTTSRVGYNGNSVTTVFAVPFRFLENTDLIVTLVDAFEAQSVQVLNTDYTVTGAGDDAGGSITMATAPASGERLIIVREVPLTQETDYISGDPFPAETHERALDKLTMITQRLESLIGRSIRLSDGDLLVTSVILPAPSPGSSLIWNSTGTALVNGIPVEGTLAISPYMEAVLGSVDAAEARSNMGAAADVEVTKLTGNQTVAGIKTFTSSPIVPTPTTNLQASTKAYADTVAASAAAAAVVPATLVPTLFVEGTDQASTSGIAINFTGIPSWAKEVIILLNGVSTNGTSRLLVQVGDTGSGTYRTTGYVCLTSGIIPASAQGTQNYTDGASLYSATAASGAWYGRVTFSRVSASPGNWVFDGIAGLSSNTGLYNVVGSIQVAGSLDKIRLTTAGGTDTFDAGQVNITYR